MCVLVSVTRRFECACLKGRLASHDKEVPRFRRARDTRPPRAANYTDMLYCTVYRKNIAQLNHFIKQRDYQQPTCQGHLWFGNRLLLNVTRIVFITFSS